MPRRNLCVDGSEGEMSDGSTDRANAVSPMPPVHGDQGAPRRGMVVSLRVEEWEEQEDLSDRRLIKAVLTVGALTLFGLAVMGWL